MIQLQFLNKVLESGDYSLLVMNNITSDFFSDYLEEYKFITNHIEKYKCVPDKTTFLSKFPDFDIINIHDSTEYLVDELYRDRNKRELARVFNEIRTKINSGDIDGAMQTYANSSNIAIQAQHLQTVDLLTDTSRYSDYVDRCNDYSKYYVSTGFKELDKILGGWDRKEELATIIGRTNSGKSWVLLKCVVAALEQGLRVGIYSGEMSERKVGYRIDTLISHISNTCISKGNDKVQNEYKVFIDGLKDMYDGCLKVLTPPMLGKSASVTNLRAFIEKEKLDILFVDQHSLLDDDKKARNPVEKASNISTDLKNLQVLLKIPIISVCQQNRTSTENGVGTTHISQSDKIGQDSTVIIAIDQKDDVFKVELIKSRDSVNGKSIKYAVDFDKGIFTYIPEIDNAVDGDGVEALIGQFEDYSDLGEEVFSCN